MRQNRSPGALASVRTRADAAVIPIPPRRYRPSHEEPCTRDYPTQRVQRGIIPAQWRKTLATRWHKSAAPRMHTCICAPRASNNQPLLCCRSKCKGSCTTHPALPASTHRRGYRVHYLTRHYIGAVADNSGNPLGTIEQHLDSYASGGECDSNTHARYRYCSELK